MCADQTFGLSTAFGLCDKHFSCQWAPSISVKGEPVYRYQKLISRMYDLRKKIGTSSTNLHSDPKLVFDISIVICLSQHIQTTKQIFQQLFKQRFI